MDQPRLDRAGHLRTAAEGEAALVDDDALVLPLWRGRVLLSEDTPATPVLIPRAELAQLVAEAHQQVFLGHEQGKPHVAVALPAAEQTPDHELLRGRGRFVDLRMGGNLVSRQDYQLLAYARGMLQWHHSQPHCPRCGAVTQVSEAGHVRYCKGCDVRHFPRTDPAIMAMVLHEGRVLLARQAAWPAGFRSVLAGFVEPGESLEQAVAREVSEEVGLTVRGIRYLASQPWPFPASLMIGFVMEAEHDNINLGDDELEAAAFYTREQVREQRDVVVPPRMSLSSQLIKLFVDDNIP